MRWDHSIPQQAEDRWDVMRTAAREQRLLKLADEAPAGLHACRGRLVRFLAWLSELGRIAARVTSVRSLVLLVGMLALAAAGPGVSEAAPTIPEVARNLAENVLGMGTVRAVQVRDTSLHITWESATYRPDRTMTESRELLYAEAQLATGSVMGRLRGITIIRFAITFKGRALATGVNLRGMGVSLSFGPVVGGGDYKSQPAVQGPGNPKKRSGQPF